MISKFISHQSPIASQSPLDNELRTARAAHPILKANHGSMNVNPGFRGFRRLYKANGVAVLRNGTWRACLSLFGLAAILVLGPGMTASAQQPEDLPMWTHFDLPSDFLIRFQQFDNLQIAFIKRLFELTEAQKVELSELAKQRMDLVDELLLEQRATLPRRLDRMSLSEYAKFQAALTHRRTGMLAKILTPTQREEYLRQAQARDDFVERANAEAMTARLSSQLWLTAAQRDQMLKLFSDFKVPPAFNLLLHLIAGSVLPPLPPLSDTLTRGLSTEQARLFAYMKSDAMNLATPATFITVANAQAIIPVPGQRYQPDEQLAPILKVIGELSSPPTFNNPQAAQRNWQPLPPGNVRGPFVAPPRVLQRR